MQQLQAPLYDTKYWWWGGVLLLMSLSLRILSYPIITSDYVYFLNKWFQTLSAHPGLTAFSTPFSDYAPLYLYFIKLLTYVPVPNLYSIKTLSVLFDVATASVGYLLMSTISRGESSKAKLFFVWALLFSIPTVVINSSLWGQSDAIYAFGVVLSVYAIILDRPLLAVTAFSFAFAVKLQAVFFLPVLVGYCLRKERTAGHLLLIPLFYFASIIPARLAGGNLSDLLLVYLKESGEYTALSVSAQNIFALIGDGRFLIFSQTQLFVAGLSLASCAAFLIAAFLYFRKSLTVNNILLASLFCVTVLPYVLPRMHERYFYLADLFSVLYALYNPKRWYIAALTIVASTISYVPYLTQNRLFALIQVDLRIPSLMMLAAIGLLIFTIIHESFTTKPHAIRA